MSGMFHMKILQTSSLLKKDSCLKLSTRQQKKTLQMMLALFDQLDETFFRNNLAKHSQETT